MGFLPEILLVVAVLWIIGQKRGVGPFAPRQDREPYDASPPRMTDRREMEREIEELRERVKVLERIATDAEGLGSRNSKAISDEIEKLRDR